MAHTYHSVRCIHNEHDKCPKVCAICKQNCICECHKSRVYINVTIAGTDLHYCYDCGALIFDIQKHELWHAAEDES